MPKTDNQITQQDIDAINDLFYHFDLINLRTGKYTASKQSIRNMRRDPNIYLDKRKALVVSRYFELKEDPQIIQTIKDTIIDEAPHKQLKKVI